MKTGSSRTLGILLLLLGVGLAAPLAAQEAPAAQLLPLHTPHFFMAVVGGVILAIGFQILLTSLSVATGISLVGNVEKAADKRGQSGAEAKSAEAEDEDEEASSPIVKVSNAIGIWTVITASLSLFFASLLAVRLSIVGTVWMGITLGLIIWAAFFATMAYLEIRSVSTLIGGVFSAALSGLRTSFSAARGVFSSSPEEKIAHVATETVDHLREELAMAWDHNRITEKLDEYIERMRPQEIDFERVKADMADLLRNVQLEEHADVKEGHLDRTTFIRLAQDQPHFKKEDVQKLGQVYDQVKSALKSDASGADKVEALVQKLGPAGEEDVHQYRQKMEKYLRETGREELNPERIKADIDQMFEDPKSSKEILLNRLNAMDRSSVIAVLSQRDDMTEEQAEQMVSNVERAIDFVRQKVMGMSGQAKGAAGEQAGAAKAKASAMGGIPAKVEDSIRQYMSSIGRPEFNYDRIRLDFERMFHDPKASPKILRARMKLYNRESLIALLSSREDMSEEDAERVVSKIEEARDNVIQRAEQVDTEVRRRIESAKRTALHEAENVRQASAAAAWWMVGTAVVSGAFSALGAAIAISW